MSAHKKTDLVHVNNGKVFTDTLVIAERCNVGHKTVIEHIRRHQSRFEEFGRVTFETRPFRTKGGIQKREIANLNEDQATVLITMLRNTDIVLDFKFSLVKAFRKAINELSRLKNDPARQPALKEKRDTAKPMTDGLVFVREMLGKKTTSNHFANEMLFCNRALTGEWKAIDEATLDTYDLRLLKAIRERNTLLIQHYPAQKDRKELLDTFVAEYRTKYPRFQLVLT